MEKIDSAKEAFKRWKAIWDRGSFPEKPVQDYFSKWENRFWLFDSQYPFYQVPEIQGTENPVKKMNGEVVESNNKIQLFSMRSGKEKNELRYDEAARWLIYLQAFDDTAAKKPSPKLCLVGSIGIITVKGDSLFETLMLNLTLLKDGQELWGEAKPSWERKKPSTQKLEEIPIPDNQAELLSLQCRRILLHREGDIVVGYTEAAGEYIEKESAFVEQMTFWSLKKKGKDIDPVLQHNKAKNIALAAAKLMWEEVKRGLDGESKKVHPARFALCEAVNIYDPALIFHPINRFVRTESPLEFIDGWNICGSQNVEILYGASKTSLPFPEDIPSGIRQLDDYIAAFIAEHGGEADYIHGDEQVSALSCHGVGILLPAMQKGDFFGLIERQGNLPKKTFSMGEGREKRYYIEAKRIK